MIYARALTEVLQKNEDPRNGSAILQRIINRHYHSIQGYDVNETYKYIEKYLTSISCFQIN